MLRNRGYVLLFQRHRILRSSLKSYARGINRFINIFGLYISYVRSQVSIKISNSEQSRVFYSC